MRAGRFGFLLLFALAVCAAGCGAGTEEESGYQVYYLNKEGTRIVPRSYEPQSDPKKTGQMIEELMGKLLSDPDDVEYQKPVPGEVKVIDYTLEETLLTLYFSPEYSGIDRYMEPLARAAVVRTLTQIDGVECLSFFVGDAPLSDNKGNPVGVMANDSFVENPGEQINSIQSAALALYFANQEGNRLVVETREVHYSSNISLEKLVMEQLLQGPRSEKAQSAIPAGTKLMNVSVSDGVCFVSLDMGFMNQNYGIEEPVVIYSIVNSLSEIASINKVQISVNGDTSGIYRDNFALDELYERNLDYVAE